MPGSAVETPQAAGLGPLAGTSLQTRSSPAAIRRRSYEPHKRANFTTLLQMPRRHCKTCRSRLDADDTHAECMSCLGKSHAVAALSGTDCSHCESFFLFRERPRDLWGKSSGAEDLSSRWQASSRQLNARVPRHHRRESIRLSSSPNTISVPLRLRATWSRLVWVTITGWQPFSGGFRRGSVIGQISFSWRGKNCFSHTKHQFLDAVLVPISQGTEVTIVTEYVSWYVFY